jgi:hypothetical protein
MADSRVQGAKYELAIYFIVAKAIGLEVQPTLFDRSPR